MVHIFIAIKCVFHADIYKFYTFRLQMKIELILASHIN